MRITFDPNKRDWTLRERRVDFKDAEAVFDGPTIDVPDFRRDYGELRMRTAGLLNGRMVIIIWTPRNEARHIISMRKANDREQAKYKIESP
jgi:uncharacterized DUF497 family protein